MTKKLVSEITKAYRLSKKELLLHVTDGNAIYLTDNHKFSESTIIIRLDI